MGATAEGVTIGYWGSTLMGDLDPDMAICINAISTYIFGARA